MINLDIASNRSTRKYSRRILVLRALWGFARTLFRLSPRSMFWWRGLLLRAFGAKVGHHVHIYNTVTVYMPWNLEIGDWSAIGEHAYIYNLGPVKVGSKTTISQRAHLCAGTHDYSKSELPLLTPEIRVGNQAWVCADAFVAGGVVVGEGAVVGARSVVVRDVEPWTVVAGNPARELKKRVLQRS
jgi:putative colanic acid biosynthesis acetyltransferase WcaF